MFGAFAVFTLFITRWAASKTRSAADFCTAGGGIIGFQNGLAIAGDCLSAASFLGISAAVMASGFDDLIFSAAPTVVSPLVWEAPLGSPKGSALFSMTIGFVGIWLFSIQDNSARANIDRAGFNAQQLRSEIDIGASGASGH